MNDVGKTIWARDMSVKGKVRKISSRYCAVCGYHDCYIVDWDDGSVTKPCTKGVCYTHNGDLVIE